MSLRRERRERAERETRELEERNRKRIADERLQIARELHDTLAHALVAINVRAGVTAHLNPGDPGAEALNDIKDGSAQALAICVRRSTCCASAMRLRPSGPLWTSRRCRSSPTRLGPPGW